MEGATHVSSGTRHHQRREPLKCSAGSIAPNVHQGHYPTKQRYYTVSRPQINLKSALKSAPNKNKYRRVLAPPNMRPVHSSHPRGIYFGIRSSRGPLLSQGRRINSSPSLTVSPERCQPPTSLHYQPCEEANHRGRGSQALRLPICRKKPIIESGTLLCTPPQSLESHSIHNSMILIAPVAQ